MGDGKWKRENKGRLEPRLDSVAGTGSKGSTYTPHLLYDILCPHHWEPGALFFPLSHEYKLALRFLICTKEKMTHSTFNCCLSWKELHLN